MGRFKDEVINDCDFIKERALDIEKLLSEFPATPESYTKFIHFKKDLNTAIEYLEDTVEMMYDHALPDERKEEKEEDEYNEQEEWEAHIGGTTKEK